MGFPYESLFHNPLLVVEHKALNKARQAHDAYKKIQLYEQAMLIRTFQSNKELSQFKSMIGREQIRYRELLGIAEVHQIKSKDFNVPAESIPEEHRLLLEQLNKKEYDFE